MPTNPYSPPNAELADQPAPAGSPIKAVLIGLAIDIGGSTALSIVLAIVHAMELSSSGMSATEVGRALGDIPHDSWIFFAGLIGGGVLSALGGYECARISRRRDYKLGWILGGISSVFGVVMAFDQFSLPVNLLLGILTLGTVLLGTRLAIAKN